MQDQENRTYEEVKFEIRNITLFLVKGPNFPNAFNVRSDLKDSLMQKYKIAME